MSVFLANECEKVSVDCWLGWGMCLLGRRRGRFHFGSVPCLFVCLFVCLFALLTLRKILIVFCLGGWACGESMPSTKPSRGREGPIPTATVITPPGDPRSVRLLHIMAYPPLPRRNEAIASRIGGYWESSETRLLFSPSSPDGGFDIIVSLRIGILKSMINSLPKKIKQYVQNYNEESKLTTDEIVYISQQATYLYYAYKIALEHLSKTERKKTWRQFCDEAIISTGPLEKIINGKTIMTWHKQFRQHEKFLHPYRREVYSPVHLESYPEARMIICQWAESNLVSLSCETLVVYVRNKLASEIYDTIKDNCRLTFNQIELSVNLINFSVSAAYRYLYYLEFKWCERRKFYYSDKHESEENVRDRFVYIS